MQEVDLGRSEVLLVNLDDGLAVGRVVRDLVDALALPPEADADNGKRLLDVLLDGVRLSGGKDEVIGPREKNWGVWLVSRVLRAEKGRLRTRPAGALSQEIKDQRSVLYLFRTIRCL